MGQELQLNVDVTAKSSIAGNNKGVDKSSMQDDTELKPFSNTLDEQLEKQPVKNKQAKETKAIDSPEKEGKAIKENASEEEVAVQDGKLLPEVSEEVLSQALLSDDESVEAVASDPQLEEPLIAIEGEVANPDEVPLESPLQAVPPSAIVDKKGAELTPIASKNNAALKSRQESAVKQVAETIKTPVIVNDGVEEVKDVSTDKKQQGLTLRSDILNALNQKPRNVGEKLSGDTVLKTETIITAQSLDKPLENTRKMAELLSQQKTESLLSKPLPERGVTGINTALTSGFGSSMPSSLGLQTASASQPVLALQPSIQSEAWGKVLSSRVVWMAREGIQQAELRLNPAQLGPVDVKLHMNNDQANVTFVAQHAATRDALEQALPRLRESFQENGMELANADVSDQDSEQDGEEEDTDTSSQLSQGDVDNEGLELDEQGKVMELDELKLGRVNLFA